jgi:hypothetical protein
VLVKPFEPQQLVSRVRQMLERVAEPAMVAVAAEAPEQAVRAGAHDVMNPSQTPNPAAGASVFDQAPFGEPESLDAPSRPVWELGLPDPIHQTSRPVEAVRPSAAPTTPPKVSLVSAFSALLAAEQSAPAAAQAAAAPVTEASVEDAVRRVLVKMTDDLVRRIVLETAERLIKEEIEKIKANPE